MPLCAPPPQTNSTNITAEALRDRIMFHVKYSRCKTWQIATDYDKLDSLSHAVRDFAVDRMVATQKAYLENDIKRVYYLSMEFLIGRSLMNNMISLGICEAAFKAADELDIDIRRLCNMEEDAGLGNGGLGRLAACYMDSMATIGLPAYGYGLRYLHGMFRQEIENGWQRERADDWLKLGSPWEMVRPEHTVPVLIFGRVETVRNRRGGNSPVWLDWQMIEGLPFDVPVIGYGRTTVNILRLWSSRAAEGFRLDVFNQGDYIKAVEEKNWAERITEVLYPADNTVAGRELRLIQEYFLVACSIRDITRRYQKNHSTWGLFAEKNAVQLNDTHPALAIAELMRFFLDEIEMPWEKAWEITSRTFAYTNHTLLPEALEKWPVPLVERVLPRHIQIIYEINSRLLQQVSLRFPNDEARLSKLSIIEEFTPKQVRMANLAITGSHSVNGVSKLHSELLRQRLVPDFAELWPEKFNNKTNGISQRRWLLASNPDLSRLISSRIGSKWTIDLDQLRLLEPFADDATFQNEFRTVKQANKLILADYIKNKLDVIIDPNSLFDVQIKRLHEYKRQLLNAMHIILLYHRLKDNPSLDVQPRTFMFGAKAAPGYARAKHIIKLINDLASTINNDRRVRDKIRVVFIPDYNVSLAEIIIPAADLSEQISTAGMEASGTGNMKLALNGALTIGTWDGANIEIAEAVGQENIFIFGCKAQEIADLRASGRYSPVEMLESQPELKRVMDAIRTNEFNPADPFIFNCITDTMLKHGDQFFHIADFQSYVDCQHRVSEHYKDQTRWTKAAILNVARTGMFSSDRAISEYASDIWQAEKLDVEMPTPKLAVKTRKPVKIARVAKPVKPSKTVRILATTKRKLAAKKTATPVRKSIAKPSAKSASKPIKKTAPRARRRA